LDRRAARLPARDAHSWNARRYEHRDGRYPWVVIQRRGGRPVGASRSSTARGGAKCVLRAGQLRFQPQPSPPAERPADRLAELSRQATESCTGEPVSPGERRTERRVGPPPSATGGPHESSFRVARTVLIFPRFRTRHTVAHPRSLPRSRTGEQRESRRPGAAEKHRIVSRQRAFLAESRDCTRATLRRSVRRMLCEPCGA